jgi:hypothetical protein
MFLPESKKIMLTFRENHGIIKATPPKVVIAERIAYSVDFFHMDGGFENGDV